MHRADPERIGWADWIWNPLACACRHGCEYCYMKRWHMAGGKAYPKEPHLRERERQALMSCYYGRQQDIFVCDDTDLFGEWVPAWMIQAVLDDIAMLWAYTVDTPFPRFMFLTKNPKRYAEFNFPENCWRGVTIDAATDAVASRACAFRGGAFGRGQKRFASCEPLMGDLAIPGGILGDSDPHWIIVGADSSRGATVPDRAWVDRIVEFADNWRLPVYIKSNLARHYPAAPWAKRRERP